jgi:DNA polymerase-1
MNNNKYFSILETLQENTSKPTGLNDRVLLVDGLNTFIRAWAVSPVTNDDGIHVGGISGSLLSIGYAIKNIKPTRVILCFDGKGGSQRRRKLYPGYKGNRKPTSNLNRAFVGSDDKAAQRKNMGMQLARLVNYMDNLPVSILSLDNIEADDTIAYISKQVLKDSQCFIMSSDKDFLQLVDDRITVWSPTKKKLYFKGDVLSDRGIPAHNFLLYRTLTGDKSDNIPGIKGAGLKTLQKRMPILFEDRVVTAEEVLKAAEDSDIKILQKICSSKDQIELNHKLMQLYEVDISGTAKEKIRNIVDEHVNPLNVHKFKLMLMEDRLTTIIRNLDFWLRETFTSLDAFAKQSAK